MAEVLEVLAIIEHIEERLTLARTEQVRAQPSAATNHLPELGFRAHELEENEVHDLRDVYAGIEHVDGDRDVRSLFFIREIVDQGLCVLGLERDDPSELALVVRIVSVESLGNEIGVLLVLREDDRLPQTVTARHLESASHQVLQHLIDCVFVKKPPIYGLGFNTVGDIPLFIPIQGVPLILVLFR